MRAVHLLMMGWVLSALVACGGPASEPKLPVCGDGVLAAGEVCDGNAFTTSCETLGFSGGELICAADCSSYSASRCDGASEEPTQPGDSGPGQVDDGDDSTPTEDDSQVEPGADENADSDANPSDEGDDVIPPDPGSSDDEDDPGSSTPNEPGNGDDQPDDTPGDSDSGGDDGATTPGDDSTADPEPEPVFTQAGSGCSCDADCGGSSQNAGVCVYGVCMLRASDACTSAGSTAQCPSGFRCWNVSAAAEPVCWPDCDSYSCAGACDDDGSCVATSEMNCDASCGSFCDAAIPDPGVDPGDDDGSVDPGDVTPDPVVPDDATPTSLPSRDGTVGSPCDGDEDCISPLSCETTLYPGGYCTVRDCTQTPCPEGTGCYETEGGEPPMCLNSCETDTDCRMGYNCWSPGVCYPDGDGGNGDYRCTADSCGEGEICTSSGLCVQVAAGVPTGTVPNCEGIGPAWNDCNPGGGNNSCGELLSFEPKRGSGYWDYPINGETENNQYRSYARRDLMLLIQYAAAQTECLGASWNFGNGEPLGLGDMSEADGSIPGTSDGDPGHPESTHENGFDMDIAYFQVGTPDNLLRPICDYTSGGVDQYHCVGEPDLLDVWRTALYLGKLHDNPFVRVIGVDGRAGPLLEDAMEQLCYAGWLSGNVCEPNGSLLTYETEDEGMGWYYFHHHHFHISLTEPGSNAWSIAPHLRSRCLRADCSADGVERQARMAVAPRRVLKQR